MFKRLFGSKRKDNGPVVEPAPPAEVAPPTSPPPPPPADLPADVSMEELEGRVSEMVDFLKDLGLSESDIVEAAEAIGGDDRLVPEYGPMGGYLVSAHTNNFYTGIHGFMEERLSLLHTLMAYSRLGLDVDRKTFDEDLLGFMEPALGSLGVEVEFSPHEEEESFTVSVRRGDLERSAEVDQSTGEKYMDEKMWIINNLLSEVGMRYLEMDTGGGENCQYFLLDDERLDRVTDKYGEFFDEVVNTI